MLRACAIACAACALGCSKGAPTNDAVGKPAGSKGPLADAVGTASSTGGGARKAKPTPWTRTAPIAPPPSRALAGDGCGKEAPIQLAFSGPAFLWEDGGEIRAVFNRNGMPTPVPIEPHGAATDAGARVLFEGTAETTTVPACAHANGHFYCMDTDGNVHRGLAGKGGPSMAKARAGTHLEAVALGGAHTLLAFLGTGKTTEGSVLQAFAALDDEAPLLLSEEGSGATFVTVAADGEGAVALYIDARRAMTPVHARELGVRPGAAGSSLALGKDAVVLLADGSEGRTPAVIAPSPAGRFGLVPIGKDGTAFGLASVRLDSPPRDDAETHWALYPNGIVYAPVGSTRSTPVRVAIARPVSAEPRAPAVLELGELDEKGSFRALCTVAEAPSFRDVSLAVDAKGGLVVAFTDDSGTWAVRRGGT